MLLDPHCRALPFDGYILGCGSAVELNGETPYEYKLPIERCAQIVEQTRALDTFGDGNNDRPMLELAPIGAGNAELRKIVRYASSGVSDGGLAEAVRAFGLVE